MRTDIKKACKTAETYKKDPLITIIKREREKDIEREGIIRVSISIIDEKHFSD